MRGPPRYSQEKIDWLRGMAKTPAEERSSIQGQISVKFDLGQERVDRVPMSLTPAAWR